MKWHKTSTRHPKLIVEYPHCFLKESAEVWLYDEKRGYYTIGHYIESEGIPCWLDIRSEADDPNFTHWAYIKGPREK